MIVWPTWLDEINPIGLNEVFVLENQFYVSWWSTHDPHKFSALFDPNLLVISLQATHLATNDQVVYW